MLDNDQALAYALKALGHPSRLSIIKQLVERDRCCGGDFCDCLPLSQSTISQHLDLLKQAGIVEWHQQGTRSIYTLNKQRLVSLSEDLLALAQCGHCVNPERLVEQTSKNLEGSK